MAHVAMPYTMGLNQMWKYPSRGAVLEEVGLHPILGGWPGVERGQKKYCL